MYICKYIQCMLHSRPRDSRSHAKQHVGLGRGACYPRGCLHHRRSEIISEAEQEQDNEEQPVRSAGPQPSPLATSEGRRAIDSAREFIVTPDRVKGDNAI